MHTPVLPLLGSPHLYNKITWPTAKLSIIICCFIIVPKPGLAASSVVTEYPVTYCYLNWIIIQVKPVMSTIHHELSLEPNTRGEETITPQNAPRQTGRAKWVAEVASV